MSARTDAAAGRAAPDATGAAPDRTHRLPILAAALTGVTMQMLDTTIANVALPHMQASLGATEDAITWVLTSYILASAVILPLSGWLVDRLGLKRLLLCSVVLFTVTSGLCGAAQTLTQMVAFRIAQGIGGACLVPIAQTVMLDYSTPEERPRTMMLFTQIMLIAPIMGPMIGGWLTENADWRWVFYVNLPLGAFTLFLLIAYMPASPTRRRPFDLVGWLLIAVGVSALQLMLDRGTSQDWFESGEIVTYAVVAACCLWMVAAHLATAKHPLFPRALLANRNLATSLILSAFCGVVLMSTMALLPVLLQSVFGYPVIDTGMLLAPRGLSMLLTITLFGSIIARADPRVLFAFGLGFMGLSLWLMSGWSTAVPTWRIVEAGMIQGIGLALTMVPLNLIAFATLPGHLRADASGAMNLMRNLGSSTGIAMCTVLLGRSVQINHAEIGAALTRADVPFALDRLALLGSAGEIPLRIADAMVNREAAMIGYINNFVAMAVGCFALIPLLLLLKRPKTGGASASEAVMEAGH